MMAGGDTLEGILPVALRAARARARVIKPGGQHMTSAHFNKFCKENKLYDKKFTPTDADMMFTGYKSPAEEAHAHAAVRGRAGQGRREEGRRPDRAPRRGRARGGRRACVVGHQGAGRQVREPRQLHRHRGQGRYRQGRRRSMAAP